MPCMLMGGCVTCLNNHSLFFSASTILAILANLTNLSTDWKATRVSSSILWQQTILSMLQEETGPTMSLPSLQYHTSASLSRVPSLSSQKSAKGPGLQFFFFSSLTGRSLWSSGLPISRTCLVSVEFFFLLSGLGSMQKSLGSYRFSERFSGCCESSAKRPSIWARGVRNLRSLRGATSKRASNSEYPIDAISQLQIISRGIHHPNQPYIKITSNKNIRKNRWTYQRKRRLICCSLQYYRGNMFNFMRKSWIGQNSFIILKMWNTRKSYPLSLCRHCVKKTCFKCSKPPMGRKECQICLGCTPSKKMRCTKCRSTTFPFMSAYYCQECQIKYNDLCAMCGYVLGLNEGKVLQVLKMEEIALGLVDKEKVQVPKEEQKVQVPKEEQKVQKPKVQNIGKKQQPKVQSIAKKQKPKVQNVAKKQKPKVQSIGKKQKPKVYNVGKKQHS